MRKVLSRSFFNRPTETVARELLGKFLVREIASSRKRSKLRHDILRGTREIVAMITDVEVYDGPHDKGSHASRGRTLRNTPMFGSPGHWYVYFTYGMHWMLNIVTREKEYPAAILIRAVCPPHLFSNSQEFENRFVSRCREYSGPARLTKKLQIDKRFNGLPAAKRTGLWIENRGVIIKKIRKGPRVGISYAGPRWIRRHWRFWIEEKGL